MNCALKKMLSGVAASLLLAGTSYALDYDFSGNLEHHNDVLTFSFVAGGTSTVTLFSSSWDEGNFDPMLGLWDSSGTLLTWQDDGGNTGTTYSNGVAYDHGVWDSYYSYTLAAGTYYVTLSTYYNAPLGNNLTDGFAYDSQTPIDIASWNQPANGYRGDDYEFHILGVESANQNNPVPEPSSFILLGAGVAGLAFARKRFKKQA